MALSFRNQQKNIPIDTRTLRKIQQRLLAALDCQNCELSVLIVDDARMQRLNAQYRGLDRPTDVLAFPMREGAFAHLHPQLLGDIVIAAETAQRQAIARQHGLTEELTHLLIHGTLHLLGYDHEVSPADARLMRAKERALWRRVAPSVVGTSARHSAVSHRQPSTPKCSCEL